MLRDVVRSLCGHANGAYCRSRFVEVLWKSRNRVLPGLWYGSPRHGIDKLLWMQWLCKAEDIPGWARNRGAENPALSVAF